jgi:hypothetical protein
MKRYMSLSLLYYPPDTGSGGGTTDNNAGNSGVSSGAVESGTASDAMIAAFAASSAAEGDSDPDSAETEEAPDLTGDTSELGGDDTTATGNAKGSQVPTGARGEAPLSRIEAATRNAREKAIQETEAKYAWAKNVQQEDVRVAFNIASALLEDTPGFAAKIAAEIGMKLVPINETGSAAAAPATGGAFKLPKAELRSEDGKGAFSEEQMSQVLTDFAAHLEAKFGDRVKPLESMRTQMTEREQRARITAEATASVNEMMADFRARQYFMVDDGKGGKIEHPSILRNLQAIPHSVRVKIGAEASMSRAYNKYLQEEVFPTIGTTAAAQVRNENARKLRGSTGNASVSGSTGRGTGTKLRDGDVAGLAAHMAKLAGANASV